MTNSILSKSIQKFKRYIAGAPKEGMPTLELKSGQETRDSIIEQLRAERQLNTDVSIWSIDGKDSFYKFLVSIDLVIVGFIVALSASGHLHELVKNESLFRWGVRLLIFHFTACLAIASLWPRVILKESEWRYIKYSTLLSEHLKLQNKYHDKKNIGTAAYKNAFQDIENKRLNIFKERPKVFNRVRLITLQWVWALILVVAMTLILIATKFNTFII